MKDSDIRFIVENDRWPIGWRTITDHLVGFVFSGGMILGGVALFSLNISGEPVLFLYLFPIFMVLAAIYLGYISYSRIKSENVFYTIHLINYNPINIKNQCEYLGWSVEEYNNDYLIAITNLSLSSWGEQITIIFIENRLLFNSKPIGQPFTDNKDSINFWNFFDALKASNMLQL